MYRKITGHFLQGRERERATKHISQGLRKQNYQ